MRRLLLLFLALSLALPLATADESSSDDPGSAPPGDAPTDPPQDEPVPDEEPTTPEPENGSDQSQSCMIVRSNSMNGPVGGWVSIDPDGCYRRLLDRVVPPYFRSRLWMLP